MGQDLLVLVQWCCSRSFGNVVSNHGRNIRRMQIHSNVRRVRFILRITQSCCLCWFCFKMLHPCVGPNYFIHPVLFRRNLVLCDARTIQCSRIFLTTFVAHLLGNLHCGTWRPSQSAFAIHVLHCWGRVSHVQMRLLCKTKICSTLCVARTVFCTWCFAGDDQRSCGATLGMGPTGQGGCTLGNGIGRAQRPMNSGNFGADSVSGGAW